MHKTLSQLILLFCIFFTAACGSSDEPRYDSEEIRAIFAENDDSSRGIIADLEAIKASGVALKVYPAGSDAIYDGIDGTCTWGGSAWSLPGGKHNWPRDGSNIDFYAASPGLAALSGKWNKWGLSNMDIPGNRDDLYGIRLAQNKTSDGGGVKVRMRHIYSKLNFTFGVDNSSLRLEVRRISVVNSRNNADYYYSADTFTGLGSWQNKNNDQYGRKIYERTQYDGSTLVVNYAPVKQSVAFNADPFLVMPQPVKNQRPAITTDWNSGWETIHFPGTSDSYVFLAIDCRVMQYVPPTGGDTTGSYVAIWPAEGKYSFRNIIVPLTDGPNDVTWEQETAYTYDIRIGEGAGWQPGGDPVLFTVGLSAVLHGFDDPQHVYPDMR